MRHPSKAAVLAGCDQSCCHPSEAAYIAGCRCDRCMRRRMRIREMHKIRAAKGPVMVLVDTTEMEQLIAEGFGVELLSTVLGFSRALINGVRAGGRTDRDRAARIMTLTRAGVLRRAPDNAHVPTVGAARRIHALMRIGWTQGAIANGDKSVLRAVSAASTGETRYLIASTHRFIATRYDRLSMTPGPSAIVQRRAESRGYAPPLAWDDETIDNPNAYPNIDGVSDDADRMSLYLAGLSDVRMAREEGISPESIAKWRRRRGLPSNYKPRGRHVS